MKKMRQAAWKRSASNVPSSALRNFIRLMLARLQAVSSRNIYSLHGLLALIRPLLGQVCHLLIVVSYCTPGSPQCQAHSAMRVSSVRASYDGPSVLPSVIQWVCHVAPFSTAAMNSSVTRTERLAFWKRMLL